ncbi:hypothetical protein AX14_008601 [Amanita brunnescens Koide BX004]|nr:hypothetical protein AX14_008601 [Amanita brunnescens Koide BX004]
MPHPVSTQQLQRGCVHTFEPTEPCKLAFEKLKGGTGIFPVNYAEQMPEPLAVALGGEAEQEATLLAQVVNVEKAEVV